MLAKLEVGEVVAFEEALGEAAEGVVSTDVSSWWPVEVYSGDEPLTDLTGIMSFYVRLNYC